MLCFEPLVVWDISKYFPRRKFTHIQQKLLIYNSQMVENCTDQLSTWSLMQLFLETESKEAFCY